MNMKTTMPPSIHRVVELPFCLLVACGVDLLSEGCEGIKEQIANNRLVSMHGTIRMAALYYILFTRKLHAQIRERSCLFLCSPVLLNAVCVPNQVSDHLILRGGS